MKYVFYHAKCNDGFGAALAAWKKYGRQAKYVPIQYFHEDKAFECMLDDDGRLKGKNGHHDVYFVDFCPQTKYIDELAEFHNVYIIDHHKTAKPIIDEMTKKWPNVYAVFDLEKSGARLAWEYFCPKAYPPLLIMAIEDRDLWRFKYAQTTTVYNALNLIDDTFETWSKYLDPSNFGKLVKKYEYIQEYIERQTTQIVKASFPLVYERKQAYCVFLTEASLTSEVGAKMLETTGTKLAVVVTIKDGLTAKVSLRSKGRQVDVSEIAKKYGGGGHFNAAGYETNDLSFIGELFDKRITKRTKKLGKRQDKAKDEQR